MATRATRGFTRIELMVLVALIGVLAPLAIGALEGFQARSRLTEETAQRMPGPSA